MLRHLSTLVPKASALATAPSTRGFFTTVRPYEELVMFTLGKCTGTRGSGPQIYLPMIQTYQRINKQVMTHQIKDMSVVTKDGATVNVHSSVKFRVVNPRLYVNNVHDGVHSLNMRCQQALRKEISALSVQELLSKKDQLSQALSGQFSHVKDEWGIEVSQVQVNDFRFSKEMEQSMATIVQAEQTATAKRIIAEADTTVAEIMKRTAGMLDNDVSMKLREMGMYERMSANGNMIILVPSSMSNSTALVPAITQAIANVGSKPTQPTVVHHRNGGSKSF